jgi:hypothetical protein
MENILEKMKGLVETLTRGNYDRTATNDLRKLVNDVHDFHPEITDDELHQILIPAIRYLVNFLENAKLASHGAYKLSDDVMLAVNTLGSIGDSSAITALERLRDRLKGTGIERQYVATPTAAGTISSQDEIDQVNDMILRIEGRVAKQQPKPTVAPHTQTEPTAVPKKWWEFWK